LIAGGEHGFIPGVGFADGGAPASTGRSGRQERRRAIGCCPVWLRGRSSRVYRDRCGRGW
jgi:hypothetical protein